MTHEKRRNIRVHFQASCLVEPMDGKTPPFRADETRDISLKGLFLKTEKRLEKGTPCKLELELSGGDYRFILSIKAKVVRIARDGMAFLFEEIDIESFYHLKNILYYNSGDPERIDHEIVSIEG